jgi:translation elongation factor EF-Tu-like GTPase
MLAVAAAEAILDPHQLNHLVQVELEVEEMVVFQLRHLLVNKIRVEAVEVEVMDLQEYLCLEVQVVPVSSSSHILHKYLKN